MIDEKTCDRSNNDLTIQNEFLAKIWLVVSTMNEIDEIINNISEEQSKADSLRSDYLHLYEDYDLSDASMIEISKKLHDVSVVRRNWNNVYEISKTYREHLSKLQYPGQRDYFCNQIGRTVKNLNGIYKDRVLTEKEKTTLLNVNTPVKIQINIPPMERKTKTKLTKDIISSIVEDLNNNKNVKTIACKYNTSVGNIYRIRKEHTNYERRSYNKQK